MFKFAFSTVWNNFTEFWLKFKNQIEVINKANSVWQSFEVQWGVKNKWPKFQYLCGNQNWRSHVIVISLSSIWSWCVILKTYAADLAGRKPCPCSYATMVNIRFTFSWILPCNFSCIACSNTREKLTLKSWKTCRIKVYLFPWILPCNFLCQHAVIPEKNSL